MRQASVQTSSLTAHDTERDRVLEAVHDLVLGGHADLHLISDKDYWLLLKTGEAFTMNEYGISRIA